MGEGHHKSFIHQLKKGLLIICLVALGGLLTLSGYNLIALSPDLVRYSGIGLLILALLYYVIL